MIHCVILLYVLTLLALEMRSRKVLGVSDALVPFTSDPLSIKRNFRDLFHITLDILLWFATNWFVNRTQHMTIISHLHIQYVIVRMSTFHFRFRGEIWDNKGRESYFLKVTNYHYLKNNVIHYFARYFVNAKMRSLNRKIYFCIFY